jgi:uncharacterized membrane protein YeiH
VKPALPELTLAVEAAAVVVMTVSGMITAARARMDLIGTFTLALVTAFGGGTLRDLILERRPLFWVANEGYVFATLLLCLAFVYSRRAFATAAALDRRAVFVDALGLALFSLTGVRYALEAGLPPLPASLLGVVTGTFGGVLRDVLVREIPAIFRPGALYAASSFVGCWVVLSGPWLEVRQSLADAAGFATIVLLRMASVRLGLRLPDPHWVGKADDGPDGPTS